MKLRKYSLIILLVVTAVGKCQNRFTQLNFPQSMRVNAITSITQDNFGYIWIASADGVYKYDGLEFTSYYDDLKDNGLLFAGRLASIYADSNGNIWIGSLGNGLYCLNPATGTVTRFRHKRNDSASLCSDSVTSTAMDHEGYLWVGTCKGLSKLDVKTGRFALFKPYGPGAETINKERVSALYVDKAGTLWAGCYGGLYKISANSGKTMHFVHNNTDSGSVASNWVKALFEDSKGNFWVGTWNNGLQVLDRNKNSFTHYYYDSLHQSKRIPALPVNDKYADFITFITEDCKGQIYIGTLLEGITQYNPVSGKITRYGSMLKNNKWLKDTASGIRHLLPYGAFISKEGLLWMYTRDGGFYVLNPHNKEDSIPYTHISQPEADAFYEDDQGSLWIGTSNGIIQKNMVTGKENFFLSTRNQGDKRLIIGTILPDAKGNLWLSTSDGIKIFNPHSKKIIGQYAGHAYLSSIYFGCDSTLWMSDWDSGLAIVDKKSGMLKYYRHADNDSTSLSSNKVYQVIEDKANGLWVATFLGLNKLDKTTGKFKRFIINSNIKSLLVDAKGVLWAGAADGLYYFNKQSGNFSLFHDSSAGNSINGVLNVIEDAQNNLWVSTTETIFRINAARNVVCNYGPASNVHPNYFVYAIDYLDKKGRLFLGDQSGYYSFFPDSIPLPQIAPSLHFTGFQLNGNDVPPGGGILYKPIFNTLSLKLGYTQNSFSFTFSASDYSFANGIRYMYALQHHDDAWHNIGPEKKIYFFNVPPGHYLLRVKAVNASGLWDEKDIELTVSPPWWQAWWAYILFTISATALVWAFAYYRSKKLMHDNRVLEHKVIQRTAEVLEQKEEIAAQRDNLEKTLQELQAAQKQLIQSEKMASLGELTAGIAHEIQNPLNFVNNFSEMNAELIAEMKEEIIKGNLEEINALAIDIELNEQKINYHGKRADAIVKGMLQHSRKSTGQKEPTDISALADEYLRLSYHGLRAKYKSFNAEMVINFDTGLPKISVIPQDIGRVLLNLFNNAFYAVAERQKVGGEGYKAAVSVATKRIGDKVEIRVADNGNGIPQAIIDKIFQPFFTTKPTGQGTGLGLSLSYDIVKAHGGEIKVETKEGEGTEFIVVLPMA